MSTPEVIISFPLEGELTVRFVAEHESEQLALLDWINDGRPEYAELVARALELARQRWVA